MRRYPMILLIVILISGCTTAGNSSLEPVITSILEGNPYDHDTVMSILSSVASGNREQYLDVIRGTHWSKEGDIRGIAIRGNRSSGLPYKGVYLSDIRDARWALSHIDRIKSVGADSVLLEVQYGIRSDGSLYIPGEKVYLFYINAFHQSGFRVWVTLGHTAYDFSYRHDSEGGPKLENQTMILDMFEPEIYKWAAISERLNADAFIPSEEANTAIITTGESSDLCQPKRMVLNRWMQEILPGIRERFSGKVGFATNDGGPCERHANHDLPDGPDFNYSGYDIILYKLPFRSAFQTDEEWNYMINHTIPNALGFAARDGVQGLVLYEIGDTVGKPLEENYAGNIPVRETDEEHQKETYEKLFEFVENKTMVIGLFFKLSGRQPHEPEWNPFGRPAESVIRENFASRGTLPLKETDRLWTAIGENGLKTIQACLSREMPFDPDYYLDAWSYHQLISRALSVCW